MENVLSAVIVLFLFLFAGYTLSESLIASQDTLAAAQLERDERLQEQFTSALSVTDATTQANGTQILLRLTNTGTTRFYDFRRWDVIAQYTDSTDAYRIRWTPYTNGAPSPNQWTIQAITVGEQPERYEADILNPGETATLLLTLPDAVQLDTSLNIAISTENAAITSMTFPRNTPPVLEVHQVLSLANHNQVMLSPAVLRASDPDDSEITFQVDTLPQQGVLSRTTFTQTDINTGNVTYTHTGTGQDTFTFTVTDGKDTTSIYTLPIFISEPPQLIYNMPLTIAPGTSGAIYNNMIRADDADDSINEVVFTVVSAPTQGTLNLGTQFTQADINANRLIYTHTGIQSDQFSFTVTDGETVIGPFVYVIQVVNP